MGRCHRSGQSWLGGVRGQPRAASGWMGACTCGASDAGQGAGPIMVGGGLSSREVPVVPVAPQGELHPLSPISSQPCGR